LDITHLSYHFFPLLFKSQSFADWFCFLHQVCTNRFLRPVSAVPTQLPSELNRPILTNILDITHLSYHFFPYSSNLKASQTGSVSFIRWQFQVRCRWTSGAWHTVLGLQREASGHWEW
jgi:hypothetical protein